MRTAKAGEQIKALDFNAQLFTIWGKIKNLGYLMFNWSFNINSGRCFESVFVCDIATKLSKLT